MEQFLFNQYQSMNQNIDLSKVEPIIPVEIKSIPERAPKGHSSLISKIAIVKLNGGLGTTMGCKTAKGCLPAIGGKSFIENTIQQIPPNIPLVLMNSEYTDKETREHLKGREIIIFNQKFINRFNRASLEKGEMVLDSQMYPPGTGDFYSSLYNSEVFEKLKKMGIEYLFVSNIDNLKATFDLSIFTWVYENKVPFAMEVCKKSERDKKGGTPILWNDKPHLLEVAQVPPNQMELFAAFPYFNTNNLWIKMDSIKPDLPLYVIANHKNDITQLETVIGSGFSCFDDSKVILVERDRFNPIKTMEDYLTLIK
jgi:UTP--glucose-1-phosphate uridylyltransferase